MVRFTNKDRAFCIKAFYENGKSAIRARRSFMNEFKFKMVKQCPSLKIIVNWKTKHEEGLIQRKPYSSRVNTIRTPKKINQVRKVIEKIRDFLNAGSQQLLALNERPYKRY